MGNYNTSRSSYHDYGNAHQYRGRHDENLYNNWGTRQKRPAKKHSGAKHTTYVPESGPNKGVEQHLTTGWKYRKQGGLVSVKAVTTKKSVLSANGWFGSVFVTVTHAESGQEAKYWGCMEKKSGKVVIDKLAWVVNPKAKNGGYCGSFLKSN